MLDQYEARAIAAGLEHSVVVQRDGTVRVWGCDRRGMPPRLPPEHVAGLDHVVTVAGAHRTLALREDGAVWVWGNNVNGEVGDGTMKIRRQPVRVRYDGSIRAIAASNHRALAVTR